MDPSIASSVSEEILSNGYDPNDEIGFNELKKRIQEDIQDSKQSTHVKVNETKAAIANLVPFLKNERVSSSTDVKRSMDEIRTDTERLLEENLSQFQGKLATDLQVIQLFDQVSTYEVKDLVKRNIIDQSINIARNKTEKEFLRIQKETNDTITETRAIVNNYLSNLTHDSLKQKEIDVCNENEIIGEFMEKTQEDFGNLTQKNQEDIDKAKCMVKEKVNKLLEYPVGRKTDEELEADEAMKAKVIEFEKIMKEDLEREKSKTEQTIEQAKHEIVTRIKSVEADEETVKVVEDKLLKLHDKTRNDFKEINAKLQDEVVNMKEKIDLTNELPSLPESDVGEKSIKDILGNLKKTIQADFRETNARISENVKDLSSKVAQNINLPDAPQSSGNSEVSRMIDISLNEFQNTFQERDKKVKDTVLGAKSKIDDSVNALKDKLFKK